MGIWMESARLQDVEERERLKKRRPCIRVNHTGWIVYPVRRKRCTPGEFPYVARAGDFFAGSVCIQNPRVRRVAR